MQLSIIIANWNTRDLLIQCLDSIYMRPPTDELEVFVVDNASTDGSCAMVQERFPQVRLLQNTSNEGFACANNKAIRISTGRNVLLLNSDTQVQSHALDRLVEFMKQHPDAGAAGAHLLNADCTLQISCYPLPTLVREFWRLLHLDVLFPCGVYRMDKWCTNEHREVESLLGACLIARREALDQVGLLDEDYFFYSEDIDLCYRLRQAGWHLYWVPTAQVMHYGGQSSRLVAEKSFLSLYHGKILYFRKQYGKLAATLYKLILLIVTLPRLIVSPLACFEQSQQREQHQTLATYYRHLLRVLPDL